MKKNYQKIYKIIKKYKVIVIARHIGADPDALCSTLSLKEAILEKFPQKKVYVVGTPASKFRYIGSLDKICEDTSSALLIVLDTPDLKRVDGALPSAFHYSIKIDHHPFIEKFCDIEIIDDSASSTCQMIAELIFNTSFKLSKEIASKLYMGIVSDTNRFLHNYTTVKTFDVASRLIKETKIDFTKLYLNLYLKPLKEVRFQGFVASNMDITTNGVAYINLDEATLNEHDVDAATAGNFVNNFDFIEEVLVWAVFSFDHNTNQIRGSIRSRGPVINEVVSNFGGGGHAFASGIRLASFEKALALVAALDEECLKYKEIL